jgi:hypothetical protein
MIYLTLVDKVRVKTINFEKRFGALVAGVGLVWHGSSFYILSP